MNKTTAVRLSMLALCVTLLAACSKPVELRFRPQAGTTRTVDITIDQQVTTKMGQMSQTDDSDQRISFKYDITEVAPDGTVTMTMEYDPLSVIPMQAMQGPMGEMFGSLGTAQFTFKLTAMGEVLETQGVTEFRQKLSDGLKETFAKEMADVPPEQAAVLQAMGGLSQIESMMDELLDSMLSEEQMKKQMAAMTALYPQEPVKVGSTWSKEIETAMPYPMKTLNTYTVTSRGEGLMNVKVESTVSPASGGGLFDADMTGTQSGTIQIEEATGWVKASTVEQDLSGKMSMGPMNMDVGIKGTIYIQSY